MPTAIPWTSLVRGLWLALLLAGAGTLQANPRFDYLLHCAGCHLEDGSGMENVVPDLTEALGWFASSEEGRSYLIRVPGSSQSPLNDAELATLLNWMVDRYAADAPPAGFTEDEVAAHRGNTMDDPAAKRIELLSRREYASTGNASLTPRQREAFGRLLFQDETLSRHGNLACASCHDPERAYSDSRPSAAETGASRGSDGRLGSRNAPSLTYIGFTPPFSTNAPPKRDPTATAADAVQGGFFWDGRMPSLEEQVLRPFVNEREMGLRDRHELALRVRDNEIYRRYVTGTEEDDVVLDRIARSLAAFLRSDEFNTFDSRYDRFLRGEVTTTKEEEVGMGLFFSSPFTNCAECHQSADTSYSPGELFTNHRYANIGTPVNLPLLMQNGRGAAYRDPGLGANQTARSAFEQRGGDASHLHGRFKVSSLRNVAVTAPYLHNGVFDDLSTVLSFYNHFNESGMSGRINPETGHPWPPAEQADGIDHDRLRSGFPLSPRQLDSLEAFLRMLTDRRYEHLLE